MRQKPAVLLFRLLVACLWVVSSLGGLAVGAELWLRASDDEDPRGTQVTSDPGLSSLRQAYRPFDVQHLHPQYLFFFPFEPDARIALSNDVVHLSAEGFRGSGPAAAGQRRLAFLVGGSAAFGHYATADTTTISGYLNRLQDEYFFVNAGVPSWISTQEMFRVAFELLAYRPALIMAYDGFNDADVLTNHAEEGGGLLTVGAPESFLRLRARVDDIRAHATSTGYLWFPELRRRLKERMRPESVIAPHSVRITDDIVQAAVKSYLDNLDRMRDMTVATGARFVAVFQPVSGLHQRVPRDFQSWAWKNDALSRFHRGAISALPAGLEFHDLSAVFDTLFLSVPVSREGALNDETIFIDAVHLTDRGNRLVAQRLVDLLLSQKNR